eukprot:g4008.t1
MHLRFGRAKRRTPKELVSRTNDALSRITPDKRDRSSEKAIEDVGRSLEQIKVCLLGHDDEPADKTNSIQLNLEAIQQDLVKLLLYKFQELEFETRKDVGLVIAAFLRVREDNDCYPMADYVANNPELFTILASGYRDPNDAHIGLISGGILRDCIKHVKLARIIAESNLCLQFVDDILNAKFEIGADALCTFRDLITKHKELMAEVLNRRFDEIIPQIHRLIESDNFFIKRQSLKLLNEILLESTNRQVTAKYVRKVQHLILLMNLLRDKYESIQFEAYHSFKVRTFDFGTKV